MAADRVLLSRDDRTVSLVEISRTTPSPSAPEAAAVGFRIVVEQCYRAGMEETGEDDDDEVDTMEDVACRVPVGELTTEGGGAAAAAAVDRAFEELVSRLDHPTLIREVAPEARKAAAHVRAMGDIGALAGAELRLRVVFLDDSLEEESEPEAEDEEEVGSDLELDEECWEHGGYDGGDGQYEHGQAAPGDDDDAGGAQFSTPRPQPHGGAWRHEHGPAALSDDDVGSGGGAQFTARPFDGALAREGGPSDGTLLLSGFEARADGPELGDQHELTPRDVRRLVRLAVSGGDVGGDEGYQRAVDGGAPVSRVTRAVMLDQGLRSARQQQARPQQEQQAEQAGSTRGMPPRMRTGL